jgi:hypothetical protein
MESGARWIEIDFEAQTVVAEKKAMTENESGRSGRGSFLKLRKGTFKVASMSRCDSV